MSSIKRKSAIADYRNIMRRQGVPDEEIKRRIPDFENQLDEIDIASDVRTLVTPMDARTTFLTQPSTIDEIDRYIATLHERGLSTAEIANRLPEFEDYLHGIPPNVRQTAPVRPIQTVSPMPRQTPRLRTVRPRQTPKPRTVRPRKTPRLRTTTTNISISEEPYELEDFEVDPDVDLDVNPDVFESKEGGKRRKSRRHKNRRNKRKRTRRQRKKFTKTMTM